MSYKAFTNTAHAATTKKTTSPFCKVCYDAKRSDYNTHYLKDFSGPTPVVLCPYLLEIKCNYCKKQGHTVSYCDILKARNASDAAVISSPRSFEKKNTSQNGHFFILREDKQVILQTQPQTQVSQTVSSTNYNRNKLSSVTRQSPSWVNRFDVLIDEHDDTNDAEVICCEEETLSLATVTTETNCCKMVDEDESVVTWAKIVSKPTPTKLIPTSVTKKMYMSDDTTSSRVNKPYPRFIHPTASIKNKGNINPLVPVVLSLSSTDKSIISEDNNDDDDDNNKQDETKPKKNEFSSYTIATRGNILNRAWWDDSSDEEDNE
jgi:hypothetical protein